MTHPGNDPIDLWLKQVPASSPNAPGVWSRRLLPGHVTVQSAYEPPTGALLGDATVEW